MGRRDRLGCELSSGNFRISWFVASCDGARWSGWAQTITALVTNKTTNKASAGDDVVLLKLAQGMQELARTKTDGKGRFTIKVPAGEAESLHMIRVTHDKANYFQPVQPGAQSVEVEVYNAAPDVEGVTLTEDVMQVQTEPGGQSLRIVEHFLVKNAVDAADDAVQRTSV